MYRRNIFEWTRHCLLIYWKFDRPHRTIQTSSTRQRSANMSTAQSAVINILLGLLSSVMMADAITENRAHVKLAPGVDPSHLKRYGSARPLFSLPYDTLKELSAAEPGLPNLTLWYEVKSEPSLIRGAPKGAFRLFRGVDKHLFQGVD